MTTGPSDQNPEQPETEVQQHSTEQEGTPQRHTAAEATQSGVPADAAPDPSDTSSTGTDWVVFSVAGVLALAIVIWGLITPDNLNEVSATILYDGVVPYGGWAFILVTGAFVLFCLILGFSRYGRIRLGADDEEPEFRTSSWVAMMFAAGMGIGLVFFAVFEPVSHLTDPPPGTTPAGSDEAVDTAMATTLFHWTVHPWAIYSIVAVAVAYSAFRKGRNQLISSVFYPLLGKERSEGAFGKAIDAMAIFATLFGTATSLGLGALQVGGGLSSAGWIDEPGTFLIVAIIALLTLGFIASASSGVAKGIKWLSNINMVVALILAIFVLVVGPTVLILNLIPSSLTGYFGELIEMSGRSATTAGEDWLAQWTIFYWAWWISWAPYVGVFLARISRGRTIRQVLIFVIGVPSAATLVWFSIFGGSAMQRQRSGTDIAGKGSEQEATFDLMQTLPLFLPIAILLMILVSIFFITSADSSSTVMGTLSQYGVVEPRRRIVVFWGVVVGAVAAVMILVGGGTGLEGLRQLVILVSVPFMLVMILLAISLWRDMRQDPLVLYERGLLRSLEEVHEERSKDRQRRRRPRRSGHRR